MGKVRQEAAGGQRRTRTKWGSVELEVMKLAYANTSTSAIAKTLEIDERAVYAKAQSMGLKKSEAFLASSLSGRLGAGSTRGMSTWFAKGHTPHNKGKKVETVHENSLRTQFKPGNKPTNWQPIGAERVNADGYLERKIAETGYPPHDWKAVHRLNWESVNGRIPSGMALCFKDGKKMNTGVGNLELVTRQELMLRNTIHKWPRELADTMRLLSKTRRAIDERQKGH